MVQLPVFIYDLALILCTAAVVTLIFKMLKQPVVLGYIIAGFFVGPNFILFPTVIEQESIKTWAEIGVIFLLFSLGLEFSFKKLLKVGGVAALTALTEVPLTLLLGFGVGQLLGWNFIDSLFLGGILSIASTTIIIRAFDELGLRNRKFAGIVTGVLVIEDLVAVLLLVLLSTVAVSRTFAGPEMFHALLKLVFFLIIWFLAGIFFLPTLFRKLKRFINDETLLIISLALCFLMVILATYSGFSSALGAFVMGSVLAETTKAEKIEHLTKSIKTLFGAIFFVSVGMLINPQMLITHILPIGAATLVLLFGKPFFVTLGTMVSGQPVKIAIPSGMSLSQIGEFSFIIAALGLTLNVTSGFLYPVAVAVSVLTTFTTPYMIRLSQPVTNLIEKNMPEKWKTILQTYSSGKQRISEMSDWKRVLINYFVNTVIFSVIIISIIFLSHKYLDTLFMGYKYHQVIKAVVTLIVLSPFLWALAFRRPHNPAYEKVWARDSKRHSLLFLQLSRIILAVLFVVSLLNHFFSPIIAFLGIIIACLILVIFFNRIKTLYWKIESRFYTNFHERESGTAIHNYILTPWNSHIARFAITFHSPYVGKTLSESKIREEFGVNIVQIERGDFIIPVPDRDNHLYPNDIILVLGDEEQLGRFKSFLEISGTENVREDKKHPVSLHHFTIKNNARLAGQSIRGSGIREKTKGLIIGIERKGLHMVNPEPDLVFEVHDKVWIVGLEQKLKLVIKELQSPWEGIYPVINK